MYDSDHENDQLYVQKEDDGSSDDEIDDEDDVIPSKSRTKSRQKEGDVLPASKLPYDPPSSIAPLLNEYRGQRHEQMREAFADKSLEPEVKWKPTEDDVLEIERSILSR